MSEPVFSDTTELLWERLPGVFREQDRLQSRPAGGYPMKRWISAVADQLDEVNTVVERVDYETADAREDDSQAVSDLADPARADESWLPWLGQLVGLPDVAGLPDVEARRAAVASATTGFRAGTKEALAGAVKPLLTGDQRVEVYDHSVVNPNDGGGEWDVLLVTRGTETPLTTAELLAAVNASGAKPAGVLLHHRTFETSWGTLEAQRPTWQDWNDATWTDIEETGLS